MEDLFCILPFYRPKPLPASCRHAAKVTANFGAAPVQAMPADDDSRDEDISAHGDRVSELPNLARLSVASVHSGNGGQGRAESSSPRAANGSVPPAPRLEKVRTLS